ncbi:unnamed protein product [Moneuplotes crassus]|uniref:AP2/ERF domain-containing protein n=1 Tax=Euplotes crassus TaxID=5936 RepID=A0AAD1U122_EUPCR|nr:unnamed protein product [Moneuplotes crassus]
MEFQTLDSQSYQLAFELYVPQLVMMNSCVSMPMVVDQSNYCERPLDLSNYCLCQLEELSSYCGCNCDNQIEKRENFQSSTITKPTKKIQDKFIRERTAYLRAKLERLYRYLDKVADDNKVLVHGKQKVHPRSRKASSRRSRYIGVFKNGTKWQALININAKKTYIETYLTEEPAARAFDLMSLILNSEKAVTNYDYSKADILELIASHSCVECPEAIVNKFCL